MKLPAIILAFLVPAYALAQKGVAPNDKYQADHKSCVAYADRQHDAEFNDAHAQCMSELGHIADKEPPLGAGDDIIDNRDGSIDTSDDDYVEEGDDDGE